MDFLQELKEIGEQTSKTDKMTPGISANFIPRSSNREDSARSKTQKENLLKASSSSKSEEKSKGTTKAQVKRDTATVNPFVEESNISHIPPPKKLEVKLNKNTQRSASASIQREVAQSPKTHQQKSKEADYNYSAKKEQPKPKHSSEITNSNKGHKSGEHPTASNNRNNNMGFAFYSFKQTPMTIGGDTYNRISNPGPKIIAAQIPAGAIRNIGNLKNCLTTTSSAAVRAVPVPGCITTQKDINKAQQNIM